jgi:hypothetical protein
MPEDASTPDNDPQQHGQGEQHTGEPEPQVTPVVEELFPNDEYIRAHSRNRISSPAAVQIVMPEGLKVELPDNFNVSHSDFNLKSPADLPLKMTLDGMPLSFQMVSTRKERFFQLAPVLITAVATLITAFVLVKQNNIQEKQADASRVQADASRIQADASKLQAHIMERQDKDALRKMRIDLFNDIINSDVSKKNAAFMTLAEHNDSMQSIIGQALNFEPQNLHENTADIVSYLFQLEDVYPEKKGVREKLFESLMTYLTSQTPRLQEGALRCFIKLGPMLKPEEKEKVVNLLKRDFNPKSLCGNGKVPVMQTVAQFLAIALNAETRKFLLGIAETTECQDARRQAVLNLAEEWKKIPEGRDEILDGLKRLKEKVRAEVRGVPNTGSVPGLESLVQAIDATVATIEVSKKESLRS